MNQYFIIVFVWVLSLVGIGVYESHVGQENGVNEQKAKDQTEFNRINGERAQQKADAAALMQSKLSEIITLQTERDKLKTDLETQYETARKKTADLAAKYSGLQLRFRAAQSGANRTDCGGSVSSGSDAASVASGSVVQLPDALAARLRQHARDADDLRDAYAKCYAYATKVK